MLKESFPAPNYPSMCITDDEGNQEWLHHGKLHRMNGPEVVDINGDKEWWVNGQRHRTDGPAIEYTNGHKEWWVNGQLHREDGPAIEEVDGTKYWFRHDQQHREDSAAVERKNGENEWWVRGIKISDPATISRLQPLVTGTQGALGKAQELHAPKPVFSRHRQG